MKVLERGAELVTIRAFARHGGRLLIEGGAGIGKTTLFEIACGKSQQQGRLVLRARGSDLESDFAFGLARQLFERRCTDATRSQRTRLFRGAASAAKPVLTQGHSPSPDADNSFTIIHGLYWLLVNLAAESSILLAIDDAHWSDEASLRWLAYLASRLEGIDAALIVTLRANEQRSQGQLLMAVRAAATVTLRPALLTGNAVAMLTRRALGTSSGEAICAAVHRATGGNPFYVHELLRALQRAEAGGTRPIDDAMTVDGLEGVALKVAARLRNLNPLYLGVAQAVAILGDGCELRHAAQMLDIETVQVDRLATELVRLDVLAEDRPPRFLHPIVLQTILRTLSPAEQHTLYRAAAGVLQADCAPAGRIAAFLMKLHPSGDPWVVAGLQAGARAALESGAPGTAADLLERALAEPPGREGRVELLRDAARAHLQVGRACACKRLEEALTIADAPARTMLASDLAQCYATLFRWTDAVHVLESALGELNEADHAATGHLQTQLVVAGLQDARAASRVSQVINGISRLHLLRSDAQALDVAQGMLALLTGQPLEEAALPLERALAFQGAQIENWDLQAALWWSLITAERFSIVEQALESLRDQVDRRGGSRALIAFYSTLGLLKLRLGALPEAETAARVALEVVQVGDFAPGLPFVATVLAEIGIASGQLEDAQALLDLLPRNGLPAGVGTVLIPAARGRLLLAQGRPQEALAEFQSCIALWDPSLWGMEMRDIGYVHARSGAAQALLAMGDVRRARELAESELADVRRFGGKRALGISLRVAGAARASEGGLLALEESATVLADSPAVLEHARSLIEWGGALRRQGWRREACRALSQALDTAARCGAGPLIRYARDELRVAGARPRRDWTSGVEALTPSELRIVTLARDGRSNRQIAEELYLSIKTVEGHLARAYGKLEISSRGELSRVLGPKNQGYPPSSDRCQ